MLNLQSEKQVNCKKAEAGLAKQWAFLPLRLEAIPRTEEKVETRDQISRQKMGKARRETGRRENE